MMDNITPCILTGNTVRLEPLSEAHARDLAVFGHDPDIWKYMLYGYPDSEEKILAWIRGLLQKQVEGTDLPFAVIDLGSGRAIGSTRYMDIQRQHRNLEIGGTWYGTVAQRTAVNTECKFLLLRQAFETYGCIRIQLKTDSRNIRSQTAIERIGATREGILRNHMIAPDGHYRASVYYSILDTEWPEVKLRLQRLLGR